MTKERIRELNHYFYNELVNNTIAFWISHSVDRKYGGFSTYLDREGQVLCTDKHMWIQARFTWLLAKMYNSLEKREEWLELAQHGVDFIKKYGFDTDGRMFFSVTEEGMPLRKRRYLYTEAFGVIAFAEYAKASGDSESLDLSKIILEILLDSTDKPGVLEPKIFPQTRKIRSHSSPMILIHILQVLRSAYSDPSYDLHIEKAIDEIFTYFVKPEKNALFETVGTNGELLDSPEGRCINPGHCIESAWFILEEGKFRENEELIRKALPLIDWSLDIGWDREYGGLYSFVDVNCKPPEQLEWDMKLWWPHNEALYATLLAYKLTLKKHYLEWFEKILDWTCGHFPDPEYGEWFGYLHRDGSVSLDLKGNKWKGPYHLPRQQLYCHLLLKDMLNEIE